jgi:hypothetical protein
LTRPGAGVDLTLLAIAKERRRRMRARTLIPVLMLLAAGCCAAGRCPVFTHRTDGTLVGEVERFERKKCEVRDLPGASGGEAVLLTSDDSEAAARLDLKPGTYELVVYAYAPSYDADGFYVHVGDQLDQRVVVPDIGKVLPCKPVRFQAGPGPCSLVLAFGEEGVLFDRVMVRPVE